MDKSKNFVFYLDGRLYITLFGLDAYAKTQAVDTVDFQKYPELIEAITNPIEIEDAKADSDARGVVNVSGIVELDDGVYKIDTRSRDCIRLIKPKIVEVHEDVSNEKREEPVTGEDDADERRVEEISEPDVSTGDAEPEDEGSAGDDSKGHTETVPLLREDTLSTALESLMTDSPKEIEVEQQEVKKPPVIVPVNLTDLPRSVFEACFAWTPAGVDRQALSIEGDIYCINNNWELSDGYYLIDDMANKCRHIHSDIKAVDEVVGIELMYAIRSRDK